MQGDRDLAVRSPLDDDMADELIVSHPEFAASIELARKQKADGQTRSILTTSS